jgi:hypothetical protein
MTETLPLTIQFTCLAAPVQAEGVVAGHPFYFRSRGEIWELTIADRVEDDPALLDPQRTAAGLLWYRSGVVAGGPFAASYLPIDEARSIINDCARAYLAERAG